MQALEYEQDEDLVVSSDANKSAPVNLFCLVLRQWPCRRLSFDCQIIKNAIRFCDSSITQHTLFFSRQGTANLKMMSHLIPHFSSYEP